MPPDISIIREIFKSHLGTNATSIERFKNGICHFVFDVVCENKKKYVIRIASESSKDLLTGGLNWNRELERIGVPVPKVIKYDLGGLFSFMILERLCGTDIGNIYDDLSISEKRKIAEEIISIQKKVSSLGKRDKYGYALSFDNLQFNGKNSWYDVIAENFLRSKDWASGSSLIPPHIFDTAEALFDSLSYVFDDVEAIPFLDDATTKNLIINDGILIGIVDTDEICFGDCLRTIALTEMSLIASQQNTDYATYLKHQLKPDGDWETKYLIYLMGFCVTFLSETNQLFNGNNRYFNNRQYVNHLLQFFDHISSKLKLRIRRRQ